MGISDFPSSLLCQKEKSLERLFLIKYPIYLKSSESL